jgi:hypothetical protein
MSAKVAARLQQQQQQLVLEGLHTQQLTLQLLACWSLSVQLQLLGKMGQQQQQQQQVRRSASDAGSSSNSTAVAPQVGLMLTRMLLKLAPGSLQSAGVPSSSSSSSPCALSCWSHRM